MSYLWWYTPGVKRPICCYLKSCINGQLETKKSNEKVFCFPRGKKGSRDVAVGWLRFVNEDEEAERLISTGSYASRVKSFGICERHFALHQFVTPEKARLNRGAIPLFRTLEEATQLLQRNDTQLTPERRDEGISSYEKSTAICEGGRERENRNYSLNKEVENSQLDLPIKSHASDVNISIDLPYTYDSCDVSDVDDSRDATYLDEDTPLYSGYFCEINSDLADDRARKTELGTVTELFDSQDINRTIKLESTEKLPNVVGAQQDTASDGAGNSITSVNIHCKNILETHDESGNVSLQVKNYHKSNGQSTSLLSEKIEDRLRLSENYQEIINSEISLSVKWEILPEEMCRLCASKEEHLKQPIEMWVNMMMKLIPYKVAKDDGLPQYVCRPCAEKLCLCVSIRQGFISSYEKLKKEFTLNEENKETELELMNGTDYESQAAFDSDDDDDNNQTTLSKLDEEATDTESVSGKTKRRRVKKYSFICMECEELFYSSKDLKNHMSAEHETFKCECCNRYFTNSSDLQEHVRTHTTETQFKCRCGTKVQSIKHLKAHLIDHKPPKHKCSTCARSFRNFFEMKHHEKIHKKIICEVCGKHMKNNAYLKVHLRRHRGEKLYQCEKCGLSFFTSGSYYIHKYKKHSNERYHCDICGKMLYTSHSFARHKLQHEKENKYKCDVCLRDFRYEFSKDLHQAAKCSTCFCVVCNLVFTDVQELKEHRTKQHLEEEVTSAAYAYRSQRTYDCTLCSRSYKKKDSLRIHNNKHHKNNSPSQMRRKRKNNVQKDVQKKIIKNFSCSKCEKKFKTQKGLKLHSASSHEDENSKFSCSYCREQFEELNTLIAHESLHLKEKVFSCCNWIFCTKEDFIRHRRLHAQNISDNPFEENYEEATELSIVLPPHVLT